MNDTVVTTTMKQAKARWVGHTRHVISDEALSAARKRKQWLMVGNVPTLILGEGEFRLEFASNAQGHVFARLNGAAKTYPPLYQHV